MNLFYVMIASFSPHFMKSSFDLVDRPRRKKRPRLPPSLFTVFYKHVHNIDRSHIDDSTYQESMARTAVAEKLDVTKFKKKEQIMNNLLYDKEITLETLSALCAYYKIPLMYIVGRTYVRMGPIAASQSSASQSSATQSSATQSTVLFMNEKNQFIEELDLTNYLDICLEKPLRSVSYYLLPQLKEMATKLLLPVENYKKQILYDSIKQVLMKLYKIEE